MNAVDSKAFEESNDDKLDPEFIHFIESLKQKCEDYDMLVDIFEHYYVVKLREINTRFNERAA